MEEMFSVQELAQELGVTTRTIRNYLSEDKLKGVKIGGKWKFPKSEVYKFIGTSFENSPFGSPAYDFIENEDNADIGMLILDLPIKSLSKIDLLKKDILNQYNAVYEGNGRQFYYQVISHEKARIIIKGPHEYVASFGAWLFNKIEIFKGNDQ